MQGSPRCISCTAQTRGPDMRLAKQARTKLLFGGGTAIYVVACGQEGDASHSDSTTTGAFAVSSHPLGPIPPDDSLARPKAMNQVGVPTALTRSLLPKDNPQSPEKVALGERLFFDGRLSANGTVACASCQDPRLAFTDGRPVSVGFANRIGQRNAPTVLNALYNKTQFWDGRAPTLEQQAGLPIVNPVEMGQPTLDAAVSHVAAITEYLAMYRRVFDRPPNGPDLSLALTSYERSQLTFYP